MKYSLVITPEAEEDLSEVFSWYESKRNGLGHDFLLQIESGFRLIEREPYLSKEKYKGVWRYLIERFPYKIFYMVEQKSVVVLAVVYGGKDPAWIKKRIIT